MQCGGKDNPEKQLLCDECDLAYHIYCLDPPLETIPDDDEWYCPLCKNDASEVWYDYFCLLAYSSCLTVLCFLVDQNKIKYFLGKDVWQQPITAGPAEGEGLWGNHPPPHTHTHFLENYKELPRESVFSLPLPLPPHSESLASPPSPPPIFRVAPRSQYRRWFKRGATNAVVLLVCKGLENLKGEKNQHKAFFAKKGPVSGPFSHAFWIHS